MNESNFTIPHEVSVLAGARHSVAYCVCAPFDASVNSFLEALSRQLLSDVAAKAFPDVISFAFWCRKANILKRKQSWDLRTGEFVSIGRGLVFHVAPSNVPVNFAFSFVFSLLAGNSNIVRVPTKEYSQVDIICAAIDAVLVDFPDLRASNAFVRYAINDEITTLFSAVADGRILWGGDATVCAIRSLPARPRCVDIVFPDRYSIAIMDSSSVAALNGSELDFLAENFYNDTYLMDQNACSSPQIVFWIGEEGASINAFWDAVSTTAHKNYWLQNAVSVNKYVQFCEDVMNGIADAAHQEFDGFLTRVNITRYLGRESKETELCELRGKGGYFYEVNALSLEDIIAYATRKYQTVTYFGINPQEIAQAVVSCRSAGVDRIVPVGKAMDIDIIWDGYDIVGSLSRIIEVR